MCVDVLVLLLLLLWWWWSLFGNMCWFISVL